MNPIDYLIGQIIVGGIALAGVSLLCQLLAWMPYTKPVGELGLRVLEQVSTAFVFVLKWLVALLLAAWVYVPFIVFFIWGGVELIKWLIPTL